MRPDPRTWLFDVIQAAQRVQRFIHGRSYADYLADELLRAGVERQFEIMGEALNQLRRQNPELVENIREHRKIIGFRNLLIHAYATVDDGIVWDITTQKLAPLMVDAQELLARLESQFTGQPPGAGPR